jgi:CubicO group peptidase (beta-lactamase class C family)
MSRSVVNRGGALVGLLATLAAQGSAQQSATSQSLQEQIPVLMEAADIPGLSAALVEDGGITWLGAFGVMHADTGGAVTDVTVFEAASLSKPVFAYAVLRLADRGEFDLDAPLLEMWEHDRLTHDDRARLITGRMVITHSSGLPNWGGFEPLGMTHSHYRWVPAYDSLAASPHDELGYASDKRRPDEGNAAASLHTTARDYARFVVAVMRGEGLSPETRAAMLTPQTDVLSSDWGDDDEPKRHLFWGLGVGLQQGSAGTAFWHWGDNLTMRCYVIAYPETGRGIVYFTNSENGLSIAPDMTSPGVSRASASGTLSWKTDRPRAGRPSKR